VQGEQAIARDAPCSVISGQVLPSLALATTATNPYEALRNLASAIHS
jgi:hypothetical protein